MSCVNTSSREFKTLLSKTDVSPATLEMVIHKIQNSEHSDRYPTPSEVASILSPKPFEASLSNYENDNRVTLWLEKYKTPEIFYVPDVVFEDYVNKAESIFGNKSVSIIELKDGSIEVQVGRPSFIPVNLNQGMFYELNESNTNSSRDILLRDTLKGLSNKGISPRIELLNERKTNPYTNGETPAEANNVILKIFLPTLFDSLRDYKTYSNDLFKYYMGHELEHSATTATYRKVEAGKGTPEEVRFYNEMTRLWNLAKEVVEDTSLGLTYFRKSLDEFTAELYSNLKFQKELAKHKDPKAKKTLLHSILDTIAKFFKEHFDLDINGSILESGLIELNKFHNKTKENISTESTEFSQGYTSLVLEDLVSQQKEDPYGIKKYKKGSVYSTKYYIPTSNTIEGRKTAENKIHGHEDTLEIGKYNYNLKGYEVIRKVTQETINKRNETRQRNKELREKERQQRIQKEYEEKLSYDELLKEEEKALEKEKAEYEEFLLDNLYLKDTDLYNEVINGELDIYSAKEEYEKNTGLNLEFNPSSTVNIENESIEESNSENEVSIDTLISKLQDSNILGKIVLNKLKELGVKIKETTLDSDNVSAISGVFKAYEKTIYVSKEHLQDNTFIHEAIHALTTYYLDADIEKLPINIQIAIQELKFCYNLLKQDFIEKHFYENGKLKENVNVEKAFYFWLDNDTYGLTSLKEMVAEIGKPEFLNVIRNYDIEQNKNKLLFEDLNSSIKNLTVEKEYKSVEKTIKDAMMVLFNNIDTGLFNKNSDLLKTIKDNYKKIKELDYNILTLEPSNGVAEKIIPILEEAQGETSIVLNSYNLSDLYVPKGAKNVLTKPVPNTLIKVSVGSSNGLLILSKPAEIFNKNNEDKRFFDVRLTVIPLDEEYLKTHKLNIKVANNVAYVENFNASSFLAKDNYIKETTQNSDKQDLYVKKQQTITQQIDNLLSNNDISASEVRHIAEQAVYWISDHITELQENPELAKFIYGDRFKNEDGTDKDFSSMSRAEVVKTIGIDNIVEMCKQKFSPENNDFEDFDTIDKATAITDNWQAIMTLAQDVFTNVENFSIVSTEDGKANEINTELNEDNGNFNDSNNQSDIEEVEGNLQEHWQIESRCQDVLSTMSQIVKSALLKCYLLDRNGNNVKSEFGINERIDVREATNSILRWTQGALSLSDMISKLQEKQEDNPWIKQIIDKLNDTSGKETDFQSQFFSTFCKHFQSYSVVINDNGKYKSIQVNESPALSEAMTQVTTQYKINEHPLFTTEGINKKSFDELSRSFEDLKEFRDSRFDVSKESLKDKASSILGYISNLFGYYVTPDLVKANLDSDNFRSMYESLQHIVKALKNNLDNPNYNPFDYNSKDSIRGNVKNFLRPITEKLEDTAISSFYDSGKMYQSYVIPSYMTKLMNKFSLQGEAFDNFIMEEYGNQPWFHEGNDIERGWRNNWLRLLVNDAKARDIFKHKVQLNFDGSNYMKNMSDVEYTLSLLTEYFSESTSDKQSKVPAWFRIPMLSNKPSSEFIRFYSERGTNYKESIVNGLMDIFNQELSRIQTIKMRNLNSKDPRFIKNFDKNGKKFNFLDFMNDYLEGDMKNSELGKLLNNKLEGKEVDENKLYDLATKAIYEAMESRVNSILSDWTNMGILEGAKKIKGIGTTEEEIKSNVENFIWNDTLAAMNIMELTVTDIAYYKNAEDLQKRLAQIHAPGMRGNIEVKDYDNNPVTDGKERTFYLKDWDDFISNVIDNVSIVFDRKIAEAPESEKAAYRALKESLVGENGAYRNINVADAQGYSSPTSYRKKAFIFGKWSKQAEDIYQKLRSGNYNYNDLSIAFQPLKPFVYSQIEKDSGVPEAPLSKLKVPVQNKNSEYLLIMADAILQNENTGRPNLLRAIYEVMEESHYDENSNYKTDGIDTVQFESTVKSGLMGRIDLNKYINDVNGEAKAKAVIEECIYETTPTTVQDVNPETGALEDTTVNTRTGKYNQTYIQEIPFEDYCLQQEVPEHFKNHEQVHGSQIRYIVVSELATKDSFGNDAVYEVEGRKVSADEFKKEYEQTCADNIEDSITELAEKLHLDSENFKDRNIALSKILQREILSSPRYGVDLLQACSIDENGRFRIPLGDPIQSKRVEQLINSIIKNRVNKQEIAGGPVVQVTNFGTSRELNIRFKDKNGNLLKTRKEFNGTDSEYKTYLKENQGGIAYFEVFAPIYANELFNQFADKNGNINIEAIEALDPDLLKMIGYRIPTEAKYSMAPLKIVGFLPREAGDGIMLPNDITLLTGSDFDKLYVEVKLC